MLTIPRDLRLPLVLGAFGLVLAAVLAFTWNHAHGQLVDLRRSLEAEKLGHDNETVAHLQTKAELARTVAEKLLADKDLAAASARLKLLAPDAEVVAAATLDTGSVVVDAEPDEETPCEPTECGVSPGGGAPAATAKANEGTGPTRSALAAPGSGQPPRTEPAPPPASACVLRNGDPASISVNLLTFKTLAGNYVPVGTATAWREGPGPRAKLFSHTFESSLSDAAGLAAPSLPRWGFGGQGVCFMTGCAAGPGIAFPPLRFSLFGHGIEIDATAALMVGALGAGASAGAFARF